MRLIAALTFALFSCLPYAEAAGYFEGVWIWGISDKYRSINDSVGLSLLQHGNIVCGTWSSTLHSQEFSGYIAGVIVNGQIRAHACRDNGQPSEHVCPKFGSELLIIRRANDGALRAHNPLNPKGNTILLKRMAIAIKFDGDESTESMLLACKSGSNIPMQPTGKSDG